VVALAGAPVASAAEEILSLRGETLHSPQLGEEFRLRQEALLALAMEAREAAPDDPEAWIWVGRRQAYLGRYAEAVGTFTQGLKRFPGDARFLRHRGHRRITQRRLPEAVADLERAAEWVDGTPDEVEPDGLPNALGIPTSTLQTNVWYHLGLARYLLADYEGAAAAYERCRDLAANPDMLVAATYWLYLSLRRAGEEAAASEALARVGDDLEIIENDGYHELLQAFASGAGAGSLLTSAESDRSAVSYPTTAYGVGAWTLLQGDAEQAGTIFAAIVESPAVTAFGYIAAEAELAR
jgi:tetratricopeptide (TPR) repeat protein